MDVTSASLIVRTAASVIPGALQIKEALQTKDPIPQAQILCIDTNRRDITERVKEAKGVLDKGQDLDLERLGNLANAIAKAEIYVDYINYRFKNKLEGKTDWEPIQKEVDKLLVTLDGLIRQPTNKDKHPENHPSGHEMPPGNIRRCVLYLSRFPKGSVFNRNRITRQGNTTAVTHEFIAGDSGMPPLQEPANFLQVVEHSCDGDRAPYHFLICDDVAERTSTWPERKFSFRETLPESTKSIPYGQNLSSLISLGGRNLTLNLKELPFLYLKNLSLRNITLKNEGFLKKLSLLQYLDLKHTNVQGCDWLAGLEDLEMLDLRYTDVKKIDEEYLQKLGKLQHLLLGYRPKNINDNRLVGVKLNTTEEMAKNMKTLRTIRRPDQLGSFSKIADLSVTGFKTGDLKRFWGAVENFENLTSLGVAMTKDSDITLQDCPAKLKDKLKRLRMEGKFYIGSNSARPHSGLAELGNFKELIDLTLASHKPINIDSIPKLSKLFCLRLYSFCREKTLILRLQGFESLKKLVIGDMAKVETVQIASDVIEKVDTLKLCNLPKFRELICLESNSQPHLLRRKESETVPFKEIQKTKTIFLRGYESFADIDFEKSPGLKICHYDMNKQCYQVVSE